MSVEAVQLKSISLLDAAVAVNPVGTDGGVVSEKLVPVNFISPQLEGMVQYLAVYNHITSD